jgi:TonB family protein
MNLISPCLSAFRAQRNAIRLFQAAALALVVVFTIPAHAADEREVSKRVAPVYPEMAKRMKITGAVKVEATVDAEGTVKEAKAVDGNRMLGPAAEEAVRKWKFAAGAGTSTVQVELHFALVN